MYIYVYVYTYIYICAYLLIYVNIAYLLIYVNMYVCIHIRIHTNAHTQAHQLVQSVTSNRQKCFSLAQKMRRAKIPLEKALQVEGGDDQVRHAVMDVCFFPHHPNLQTYRQCLGICSRTPMILCLSLSHTHTHTRIYTHTHSHIHTHALPPTTLWSGFA